MDSPFPIDLDAIAALLDPEDAAVLRAPHPDADDWVWAVFSAGFAFGGLLHDPEYSPGHHARLLRRVLARVGDDHDD